MEQEKGNTEVHNAAEASTEMPLPEKNGKEVSDTENIAGASCEVHTSQKRTSRKLRARFKGFKNSSTGKSAETKNAKSIPEVSRKFRMRKMKSLPLGCKEANQNGDGDEKKISGEEGLENNVADEEYTRKGKEIQENRERILGSKERHQKQNDKEKCDGFEGNSKNESNKRNVDGKEKRQQDERKREKLGGLIFMCNAKTKPDCFHYRVMGMSMGKRDLVLSVKPGLKLFLYDFDLKLMYGIYEASSSGGMKLEPKAFGGSFPVQVRFNVNKDCFPLSENAFRKALKDNYYEKHKFNTELTVRQVKKLSNLFRPAVFQSQTVAVEPVPSRPIGTIHDRELYEGTRDPGHHLARETLSIPSIDGRGRPLLSHERDQHIEYHEAIPSGRLEMPRDLYMSEKEYRTYGLQGERRNLALSQIVAADVDPYRRDQEREHLLRQQGAVYRDALNVQRESALADPLYLTQREVQIYNLGAIRGLPPAAASLVTATPSVSAATASEPYTKDPYYPYQHSVSSLDLYVPHHRGEKIPASSYHANTKTDSHLVDADLLPRRGSDQVVQLYSKYAVDASSSYNQLPRYHETKSETVPASVSSRHSFAGPSLSYR